MMATGDEQVLKRELENVITTGEKEINRLWQELGHWKVQVESARSLYEARYGVFEPVEKGAASYSGNGLASLTIREAVAAILTERKQPMKPIEILAALVKAGKPVGGRTPADTIRATMTKHPTQFRKLPDGRWSLEHQQQSSLPIEITKRSRQGMSLRSAVLQVVRDAHGEPLHRKRIWEIVQGMGATTNAQRPASAVDLVLLGASRTGIPVERAGPGMWRWTGR